MDFMRILRSLEELLYEVMTWLVFYPRMLFRTAFHPVRVLEYSQAEMGRSEDEQYQDSLSPPLFLILTLVISHGIELAFHLHPFVGSGRAAEQLFNSDQNLVMLRALMFALFPLMFALQQVKDSGQPLTRKSLRGPFFGECYPASVFCLAFGIGGTIQFAMPSRADVGVAVMTGAVIWYLLLQVIWLKRSKATWTGAVLAVASCFLKAVAVLFAVALTIGLAVAA